LSFKLFAFFIAFLAQQLPLEPLRDSGQSVTPAYEGWYRNADGTISLLVGYFNRNLEQTVDVPVGPNNHVDPGGPDRGQPTHFLTHRQWGVFTIVVPGDFPEKTLTWTLVSNGRTMTVPMRLHKDYEVEPLKDAALGNTPPVVQVDGKGPKLQGPPRGIATTVTATVGRPIALSALVTDDNVPDPRRPAGATPLSVTWTMLRGPGSGAGSGVVFGTPTSAIGAAGGTATTTATFSTQGDYVVRLQANDVSGDGGGGFQCCWTSALIRITVN
jgi:hypothetical protein